MAAIQLIAVNPRWWSSGVRAIGGSGLATEPEFILPPCPARRAPRPAEGIIATSAGRPRTRCDGGSGTMIGHHPSRVTRTWADQAHWWIWAHLALRDPTPPDRRDRTGNRSSSGSGRCSCRPLVAAGRSDRSELGALPRGCRRPLDRVPDATQGKRGVAARTVVVDLARPSVTPVERARRQVQDGDQVGLTHAVVVSHVTTARLTPCPIPPGAAAPAASPRPADARASSAGT
jgi:hypothetical protein